MTLEQRTIERDNAFHAMLATDKAWQAELELQYGDQAGDKRYLIDGVATPNLAALHQAYRDARDAYVAAQDAYLKLRDWGQA
jgi:hypothetical protein